MAPSEILEGQCVRPTPRPKGGLQAETPYPRKEYSGEFFGHICLVYHQLVGIIE